jgi:hypothetical protein
MIRNKEKWEKVVRNRGSEAEIHSDERYSEVAVTGCIMDELCTTETVFNPLKPSGNYMYHML